MTRPAEGPGTPQREMVILDRIRLTGLLQKSPVLRGFSILGHDPCITGPSRANATALKSGPRLGSAGFRQPDLSPPTGRQRDRDVRAASKASDERLDLRETDTLVVSRIAS